VLVEFGETDNLVTILRIASVLVLLWAGAILWRAVGTLAPIWAEHQRTLRLTNAAGEFASNQAKDSRPPREKAAAGFSAASSFGADNSSRTLELRWFGLGTAENALQEGGFGPIW
jgi:hypothetical protein